MLISVGYIIILHAVDLIGGIGVLRNITRFVRACTVLYYSITCMYKVIAIKGGGSIFLVVGQRILWKVMARLCAAKFSNLILFMTMTSSQSATSSSARSSKATGMLSLPTSA